MAKNPVLIGLNDVDNIYGSQPQQDFARSMAKQLLGEQAPTDARHWSQGLAYVLRQLAGAQYRDISGSQLNKQVQGMRNQVENVPTTNPGRPVEAPFSPQAPLRNVPGIVTTPLEPPAKLGGPESTPAQEAAKSFEGFNPNSYQDGKNRMSIGYGTEGKPGETIDKAEGTRRFNEKWAQAEKLVTNFHPNMDEGLKEALTDLTYNTGTKWMTSGLGAAVKAGDMARVRELFNEYNKADMGKGLETQPGLVNRRDTFTDLIPDGRMNAGLSDVTTPQQAQPNTGFNTGQGRTGPAPYVQPGITDQQFEAMLRSSPPEKWPDLLKIYRESHAPRDYNLDQPKLQVLPGNENQPAQYNFMAPFQGQPVTPGSVPTVIQGDPRTGSITTKPAFGDLGANSPADRAWQEYGAVRQNLSKADAEAKATEGIIGEQAKGIQEEIGKFSGSYDALKHVNSMIAATERGGAFVPRGPTAEYALNVRKIIDNFLPGMGSAIKGTNEAEIIDKLNGVLASEATKLFTNRGTNFDLQTFMRANPGLSTTLQGSRMLLDLMKQGYEQNLDIASLANKQKGTNPEQWMEIKKKYLDEHPLTMKDRDGVKIYMRTFNSPDEMKKIVPKGEKFILPDGTIGVHN